MMDYQELITTFSETVGIELATQIVDEGVKAAALEPDQSYSTDEVSHICEEIQQHNGGSIAMLANELRTDQQAEKRFETFLENVPDPAVVVGFEAQDPIVQSINQSFAESFDCRQENVSGTRLQEITAPVDDTDPATHWFAGGPHSEREIRCEAADGTVRTFLVRSVIVRREIGEVEGYGIYTDITERIERERELRRTNEQLERFASVVSHDLRNPLNVASGHLTLAKETGDLQSLDEIQRSLERMHTIIEDVLTLARIGQSSRETVAVSLEAVAREAWGHVETGDGTLVVDCDLSIRADRDRLLQLFENVIRNALEHGGTETTATVGRVEDGFFVADDGPGVPPDRRERVLEFGYTTNDEGTGFGLAIVAQIAEAHGWELTVGESESGGAKFLVRGVTVV